MAVAFAYALHPQSAAFTAGAGRQGKALVSAATGAGQLYRAGCRHGQPLLNKHLVHLAVAHVG